MELVFSWFTLTTVSDLAGAIQAPEIWGWLGLRLCPVIKYSPAHVLALCVPITRRGYVGVCSILVHGSVV